jgi:hypothetical protein
MLYFWVQRKSRNEGYNRITPNRGTLALAGTIETARTPAIEGIMSSREPTRTGTPTRAGLPAIAGKPEMLETPVAERTSKEVEMTATTDNLETAETPGTQQQ